MKRNLLLLCALLLLALNAAWAQMPPELASLPLEQDPAVLAGQLPNGLSYYIMRNPKPANIAEMRLYVDVGSVNEDDDQRGLAHFTEHMVFNGTKNFDRAGMVNYLSSIGMGYYNGLNGMTSYDFTAYTFKIPTDDQEKLRQGLLILSDMAWQVSFKTEEIERERGVIIEEWRMGQDADSRIRDAQNSVFLAGSRYAERSPIGVYDVLSTFQPETIKRFYNDWYRPDMQSVVIVGDFEPQAMLALVEEYFGPIPAREDPRPREDFSVPDNLEPQAIVTTDPEYPRNVLNVMWKKEVQPVRDLGGYFEDLKRNLFYTMFNTRLDEFSKQADPPYSFAAAFEYPLLRTMSTASVFSMYTPGKSEQALSTVLREAERIQRYGFLPSEFDRAKTQLLRYAEQEVAAMDTRESGDVAWSLLDGLANKNVFMSPVQKQQLLEALLEMVSLEEVNAIVANLIPEKNMFISLSGPEAPGMEYPSSERLLEIAGTVGAQELAPYEDNALNEPIMSETLQPQPLKKESRDKKTETAKWVLANGITVYAKKTDFKADEVQFTSTSPGGYSLFPASDVVPAQLASRYLRETGFGNFDAIALDKATVGHIADVSFTIGLSSESCDGFCSPQDLEMMFQMLYQYATSPRFNEADFASFLQRTKAYYANRNLDPMNVFFDRMSSAFSGDNPYVQSLASANLDAVTLADIQKVWQDRFADWSDFSFVFVGNFDEALLKQYCQTYLSNLPTLKRKDKARDVGIRKVKGINEIRFNMGASDRSFVAHFTHGNYAHSVANNVQLSALEFVLNEKLRENIRENLSGVYFIQAMADNSRFPKKEYRLGAVMGCSPARVDELNAAIFATLDSLAAGNLDESYLVAARATMQQQWSENIKDNYFWLSSLSSAIRNKRPLGEFLAEPGNYDRVNYKSVVKAARKYLNFAKNRFSLIMLPGSGGE